MTSPVIDPAPVGPWLGMPFPPYCWPPYGWPFPVTSGPTVPGSTPPGPVTRGPGAAPSTSNGATTSGEPTLTRADKATLARSLAVLRAARAGSADPDQATARRARNDLSLVVGYLVGFFESVGMPASPGAGLDDLVPATRPAPDAALDALDAVLVRLTAPGTRGLFGPHGFGGILEKILHDVGPLVWF